MQFIVFAATAVPLDKEQTGDSHSCAEAGEKRGSGIVAFRFSAAGCSGCGMSAVESTHH